MSQKIKHSKIKNTGLLFEILTRQVTADILNNKESKSVSLLKKYFNEEAVSPLGLLLGALIPTFVTVILFRVI